MPLDLPTVYLCPFNVQGRTEILASPFGETPAIAPVPGIEPNPSPAQSPVQPAAATTPYDPGSYFRTLVDETVTTVKQEDLSCSEIAPPVKGENATNGDRKGSTLKHVSMSWWLSPVVQDHLDRQRCSAANLAEIGCALHRLYDADRFKGYGCKRPEVASQPADATLSETDRPWPEPTGPRNGKPLADEPKVR